MSPITTRREGDVLVVTSDNPPVNALGVAVRRGLHEAVAAAQADAQVKAVVIRCEGRTFFAGADITEFGKPPQAPGLGAVIDAIEASKKPVVAAIHGTALGGGLEVALGCRWRVAARSAKLGLPEVKLGLIPGAGGTQRLPRVIGVEAALPLVVLGDPIGAEKAQRLGLVDRLADEAELEAAAIALAREAAAGGAERMPTRERTDRLEAVDAAVFDSFRKANARRLRGLEAPEAGIEAVRASTERPFDEGVALERELFMRLVGGGQSRALRHNFFAERAAAKVADLPADTQLLPVRSVGIVGAGTMGGGIAMNFLSAGLPVTLVEREQAALDRGVATVRRNYEATARKGRLTPEAVEAAMGRLSPSLDFEALSGCDLIIEAAFETMEVKKEVFTRLDALARPGAILASNTSYLNIDEIAAVTKRPQDVIGLHFFSPANVMKLLEVVRGAKTSPQVLATCMALAKTIGKVAVVSGVCHGFIGNRMLKPRGMEAERLILQGAPYWRVDKVLTDFGFPMGPFQMGDLAGLDLGWDKANSASRTLREVLNERDRRGQKAGRGFYDYDSERNRTVSPEVEGIIADFAARTGEEQREVSDEEILQRLLYPMINEGALILEEGVAQRPSDIDVVWLNGYGWPAWTGGPMFWADSQGLQKVVAGLERHAPYMDPKLRISSLLRDKAARGEGFEGG
ncbi:MAG: enoyl-CoA hydratase/isomerase family protein [Caulobacteraceae bacterium]|nr:enoyl-CoA hydratase/isomerase family protein [Caulobacter sp.]